MAASTAAKSAPLPETPIPRPAAPQDEPRRYYGASNFFPLLTAVAEKDISHTDFVLCMVIAQHVSNMNKVGKVYKSEKEIAQEAGMTHQGVRSALRNPLARHVIERDKKADIWGRRWYRLPLRSQWIDVEKRPHKEKADAVEPEQKPKQTRPRGTAYIGSQSWVRPFGESKEIELDASSCVVFKRGDGSFATAVQLTPGSAEFRWPPGSKKLEEWEMVSGHQPSNGTAVVPRHQDTGSSPPPAEAITGSSPASRRVPIVNELGEPICGPEGALVVDVDGHESLYRNVREEKSVLHRAPSAIFAFFQGKKGMNPRYEPLPAQPKLAAEREQIPVKSGGPTGNWDRVMRLIESAAKSTAMYVDPHSFSTWLRPVVEKGVKPDGTLVMLIPNSPFHKRLEEVFNTQICIAFWMVTGERRPLLQYVTEDEAEIVPLQTAEPFTPKPPAKEACAT